MSAVTLTRVFRKDKETRYGIKQQVGIQTKEHGDKWLSSFKTQGTEDWQEGMTVNINIQEKGDFLNFTPVLDGSTRSAGSSELDARITRLENEVFGGNTTPSQAPQEDVIQADELPDFGEEEDAGDGF